jgi:hypothetical protein
MNLFEKTVDFFFHEFSEIKVDIIVKDSYVNDINYPIVNEDGNMYYPEIYCFDFTFNSDFHVESIDEQEINYEYYKFIEKKRFEFYQEIDDAIVSETSLLKINNLLRSYKVRFNELLSNYFYDGCTYLSINYNWLKCKVLRESISENKRIDYPKKRKLLNSYLVVQKETIENILAYIDDKLALVKTFESISEDKTEKHKTRDNKPVTKLDQYQVALLFEYLKEVDAIKVFDSYSGIADEVSKLSGFSKQHLRTRCFPNIWQIKTGIMGNITSIKEDPDINLKTVKNLILEINNKIHEDLEKNRKSRTKS